MAKKNFKGIRPDNPALSYISEPQDNGQDEHVVHDGHNRPNGQYGHNNQIVHDGQHMSDRQYGHDKAAKCHINLRVSQMLKDYLTDASWRERKNITQYLTDLIEVDMKNKQLKQGEDNSSV